MSQQPGSTYHSKGSDWAELARIFKELTTGVATNAINTILSRVNNMHPFSQATAILDNGCGPGQVMAILLQEHGSTLPVACTLSCCDFSAPMIEQVDKRRAEEVAANPASPWKRVTTQVLDALDLKTIPDASQSHITAGWVYFLTADPKKCLSESMRVLQKDGVLGCSSWKGSQWMDAMKISEVVRPDRRLFEIPAEWRDASLMSGELEKAGFRDVEAVEVAVEMKLESYEAMYELLTTKMPPMVAMLKDFSPEDMQRLREQTMAYMKQVCPTMPGTMHGTALVAVGRK